MTDLVLGVLRTIPLQDHDAVGSPIGEFTLAVKVPKNILISSGDKWGYCRKMIAAHLASAVTDTKVPVEYWTFEPDLLVAREFQLPEKIAFAKRV